MDISIPYYEDNSRISNSAIGWFLNKGATYLHGKLTKIIPDEVGPQLERGTMIHEYILQPEEFEKDYKLFVGAKPSSDKQQAFCEALANSTEIEPNRAVLEAYKATYSTTGKSEDKMLSEGLKMASTLKDYIETIRCGEDVKWIGEYELLKCQSVQKNINEHKFASILLNNPEVEEHHEFHINWEYNGVNCKSLLDCVQFDYTNKHCNLIDLKTTVNINNFADSMTHYDYLRQLCFYTMALKWYLKEEKGENPDEWTWNWYIMAIDSTRDSTVRVFQFTESQVYSRFDDIVNALSDIKWHFETSQWEHSKAYYEGSGCEMLNL